MKSARPVVCGLIINLVILLQGFSQDQNMIDSLRQELTISEPDTNRARILFKLTWEHLKGRSVKMAERYADSAMALCKRLNYQNGIARVNYYYGVIGRLQGEYQTALKHFEAYNSFHITKGDSVLLSHSLYHMAVIYSYQGDYRQSLDTYLRILKIYESIDDSYSIATTLNSIGIIYKNLKNDSDALQHYHRALKIFRDMDAKIDMADCLHNIGNIHAVTGEYELALKFYGEALDLDKDLDNQWGIAYQLSGIGHVYGELKQYEKAITNHRESLGIRKKLGQKKEIAQSYNDLGETYLKMKNYQQAIRFLKNGLEVSKEIGSKPEQRRAYLRLSKAFAAQDRFRQAYEHHQMFTAIKDSLLDESSAKQINELQAKYEFEKKEKEIALITKEQEAQKAELLQQRNLKNILVFGVSLLAVVIVFLILGYRQKLRNKEILAKKNEEINRKRIEEMEKNQKLHALDAMVNGQEAERKRIAQDLHDGLGVLLSNVQMHFNAIQEEINKIRELEIYHKANHLLDEACGEVRKIAHNMMPGTLLKLGLIPAIKDMCNDITGTRNINIEFHAFDLEERLSEATEVAIYRLVQEALNNVVKHARANEVLVQLSADDNSLNIAVEDDGIGFNISTARQKGGMGLKNLESRVKYLNGELQITSRPGKGTVITIDIPLKTSTLQPYGT